MNRGAVLLLLVALPVGLAAQANAFDRVADFGITIKTLTRIGPREASAYQLDQRYLILNGTVAGLTFVSAERDTFAVEVELVSGEWIGLEEVRSYRCLVRFEGPEFYATFPRRAPRNPAGPIVTMDDRVLVVARAVSVEQTESGEYLWVLRGVHVRLL